MHPIRKRGRASLPHQDGGAKQRQNPDRPVLTFFA